MITRITDARVITFSEDHPILDPGSVVVEDDKIVAIDSPQITASNYPDAETISLPGHLILPGLINAHTHLYRSLGRGLPLEGDPPANFVALQEAVWWRLDKALQTEDLYVGTLVSLMESVRQGCTTVFDHHSSPSAPQGSLDEISRAALDLGVRACLSFQVSDREGKAAAKAGIEESGRFLEKYAGDGQPLLRAMAGLHTSFTVNNQTLEKVRKLAEKYRVGIHINVAEDNFDLQDALLKYEKRVVQRLHDAGILGERTLAAHGVYIDEHEMDILHTSQAALVHNPRSNMNNAAGTADVPQMLRRGVLVGLGTDGFGQNPLAEFGLLALVHKSAKKDPRAMSLQQAVEILFHNNPEIVERAFGYLAGRLEVGAAADLVSVQYDPPTPITADNIPSHLELGLAGQSSVDNVMIHGRWILRDGRFLTLDEPEIVRQCRRRASALWERMPKA
jgi:putative selenium metabolism protein SsnA